MYRLPSGGAKKYLVRAVALVLLALVVLWLGYRVSSPQSTRDFEDCVEQVQAKPPSNGGDGALLTDCNAGFAGRRKAGGGYTYYDFMQDRNFDIAGPNPTAEERKEIDRAYMGFLDAQRREAVSAELAKRQNEQLRGGSGKLASTCRATDGSDTDEFAPHGRKTAGRSIEMDPL
jgi:hypothetical protein